MRAFASLRRRGDFSRLRRRGRRVATPSLTVYRADASRGGLPLVGISTGRAVGGAVVRNRIRRRILAILDELFSTQAPPERLLVEARPAAATLAFERLRAELARAIRT